MKSAFTIRQFLSLALVVLFACSIVPQQTWHDVFASCETSVSDHEQPGTLQIKSHKYNCTGHQADVQCPFIAGETFVAIHRPSYASPFSIFYKNIARQKDGLTYGLRGPPSRLA